MKNIEKSKAKELRSLGKSIKQIAETLHVSTGSVSKWVTDIVLTDDQKIALELRNPIFNSQNNGAKSKKTKASLVRSSYQIEGRSMAQTNNQLHTIGCMLYWAEGDKSRNRCSFTNSDINMMKLFIKFVREVFHVPDNKITISVKCYLDNNLSIEDIENYWLQELQLEKTSARKHTINLIPKSSQGKKKRILPYGTCTLRVNNTQIVQHIYGAIQEYGMFSDTDDLKPAS